ncbi:helix-turn-helix transcriptional regulator [Nesterenkonia halotolerans]|uniref:DNA-binding PadR family transcriptional regulator n=1 Tax=Nesterenkonia halotolerans TaxID=225325 RepID=A0ABR9J8C0_9MICC|nr:helix-turn-helix transcriptional regulator [Nesterenkonia halotolerans]MBE1515155.1 DNA-binding PadR family transcriptional regulator [Nesterenkonia halotolerans]
MTGSFTGDSHSRGIFGDFRPTVGGSPGDIWEALDQLRGAFKNQPAPRAGRGDVRSAVLSLLSERAMHGYQIIHEIEERSGGSWKPSPGSIYPTLQLLADEGLIHAEAEGGRKTYSLTAEGREAAEAAGPWPAQGQGAESRGHAVRTLSKAGMELAQAAAQVGRSGTPEQIRQAEKELDQVRRRLYSILAQD